MHIVNRVIEGDVTWIKTFECTQQLGPDRLVVGDDGPVSSGALSRIRLELADDGHPLAAPGENKGALPGQVVAKDKGQHRVAAGACFAHKG